jgi:hypothetical protein
MGLAPARRSESAEIWGRNRARVALGPVDSSREHTAVTLLYAGILGASLTSLASLSATSGTWWLLITAIMSSFCAGSALAIVDRWVSQDQFC